MGLETWDPMIFLVGFMGSGKSAVGQALARRLSCPFLDLDERIEAAAGRPIAEIFDRQGEAAFRDLEYRELRAALRELGNGPAVVALGGGAFVQPRNAELVEQSAGLTVWLDAPLETLLERCGRQGAGRPLARDPERFGNLYRERLPFYERARLRVNAAAQVESVVEEILAGVGACAGKRGTPPARREA